MSSTREEKVSDSAGKTPVYLGITTLPSRIEHMRPTLDSLLGGELVPDRILVALPETSLREARGYDIPSFFDHSDYKEKVTIVRTEKDYGPGTKLLGILPHIRKPSYVVVADDDNRYRPFFLKALIGSQSKDHRSSFSFFRYLVHGVTVGQGADGFSFWSENLEGIEDFYDDHIDGTDLMFHDDLWISYWLLSKEVRVRDLRALLTDGKLVYENVHQINSLFHESGRLARSRLNDLVLSLFNEAPVRREVLQKMLNWPRNSPCICGSNKRFKHCHG